MTLYKVISTAIQILAALMICPVIQLYSQEIQPSEIPKLTLFNYGYGDCLRMQVKVDGKDLDFMIDTGSDLNVIDSTLQDKVCTDTSIVGKSEQMSVLGKANLDTEIGQVECAPIGVYSFSSMNNLLAADIYGVIGLPILSEFALENDSGEISIVERVVNANKLRSFHLEQGIHGSLRTKDVEIAGIRYGPFLIDTGNTGAVSVDKKTFESLQANGQLTELQTINSFTVKGKSVRRIAVAKEVSVWGIVFSAVPVSESDGLAIGLDMLRRIEFRLSFRDCRISVGENRHSKTPFLYNRTGLSIASIKHEIVVDSVTFGSEAMRCGLEKGDIVQSIDGYKVERSRLNATRMRIATGTPGGITLDVIRDDFPIRIKLGK